MTAIGPRFHLPEAFHRNKGNPETGGHSDAIKRAFLVVFPLVVAWNAPLAWYWQIALFVLLLVLIGAIIGVLVSRR